MFNTRYLFGENNSYIPLMVIGVIIYEILHLNTENY
jgi:hypothetical protein